MNIHRANLKGGPFDGRVQFLLVPVPRIVRCDHRPRLLGEQTVFHHYLQCIDNPNTYRFERTDDTMLVSSPQTGSQIFHNPIKKTSANVP